MPQSDRSKFGVSDALVIAVLRHARYDFKSSSVKDLENDETALALWNDKMTTKRDIYRFWTRDPDGDNILPGNSFLGKMTSNKIQFWGATLWDFFWTNRLPKVPNLRTGSTSSKLSKWMIEHKETQHAAPELGWAKDEADPCQILPYPIAHVIEAQEMRIRLGLCGKSMPSGAGKVKDQGASDEKEEGSDSEASDQDEDDNEDARSDGREDQGSDKEACNQGSSEMAIDKPDDEVDNKDENDGNEDQGGANEASNQGPSEAVDKPDVEVNKDGSDGNEDQDGDLNEASDHESSKMTVDNSYGEAQSRESDKEGQEPVMFEDYPAPWPLIPFSCEAPKIEQRLPLHMLPKRLIVHDPWDLLSVTYRPFNRYREANETHDWTVTEDKTYVYNLSLSPRGKTRIEEELAALKETKERKHVLERLKQTSAPLNQFPDGHDGMLLCPSTTIPGPAEPPILAIFPVAPDLKPVEEAHLYITPDKIAGQGNHSLVLHAEWEIPRSLLVADMLCNECLLEDVQQTLIECDGEDGSRKPPKFKEKSGRWKAVEYCKPEVFLGMTFDSSVDGSYLHDLGTRRTVFEYEGPVRHIMTNVKWQSADKGPYCSHFLKRFHMDKLNDDHVPRPHPPTAKVSLIAKLSTGDEHLDNEAENYESFPQHFFEHWSGYNVVDPMHKPVPVNAVVPQYYGYYVPEKNKHMSPILLMEDCGRQINVDDLCMDDRNECATLFYKFHHAGYLHESSYPRNVLYQKGPLNRPRYQRGTGRYTEDGRKYTFRLIDFGRSRKFENGLERSMEESSVAKLLKIFHYAEF